MLAMDWILEAEGDALTTPLTLEEIQLIRRRKNTFKASPFVCPAHHLSPSPVTPIYIYWDICK